MSQAVTTRRHFLLHGVALTAATASVSATEHAGHEGMLGHGGADGYVMSATVVRHCATCDFWGGQRRVSADGKTLTVGGLGWCNNPQSPNYQKQTSPEHGPMEVWRKWSVLG